MIARVAIDLALDKLFAYSVPGDMEKKLAVGQLLSVPFGRRMAQGFVLELGGDEEAGGFTGKLKSVDRILDEVPFFSPTLLELVRRLAAYIAAPIESVLKAAVPAAVLKPGARPKELMFIAPSLPAKEVEVTKRQQWIYDQIVRLGGGWMNQLCAELDTTPATLKLMGQKGLLQIAPRRRFRSPLMNRHILPSKPMSLNPGQQRALDRVFVQSPKPLLVNGITGSGKTEIYLQAIARVLEEGKGAIVMVPEIALTPQTVQRFAARFGDRVAVLHSALSDGERYDEWHRIRSGKARVVVGPRSAVFAPVNNLGLIVVDEEHEHSYKQEDNPRYHARDVAVLRGTIENAKVVLGSATPSLESYRNAMTGKYDYVELSERAGPGTLPQTMLVDLNARDGDDNRGGSIYSRELLEAVRDRLARSEQTILFLNRRGYSRSVTCEDCGGTVDCDRCDLPYTYHRADQCLRCHLCGRWIPVPRNCPHCGSSKISYRGIGTQRAEAALSKCFPKARILRMDADSTSRKHSHDDILGAFRRHEADILLGTQMIAKGLDFPNVTLVGVLNADQSLNMPDFRAAERTFQLIAQVSGRAGRAELPGEVIIQTRNPAHPAIKAAAACDFKAFARQELAIREEENLPPYTHLSVVHLKSQDRELARAWAEMWADALKKALKTFSVSEAMPSAIERADGWYRYQIVVSGLSVSPVIAAWKWLLGAKRLPQSLKAAIDVDAYNLI